MTKSFVIFPLRGGEYEKILTGFTGRVVEICAQQGATVHKGDVIGYILRSDIFA